MAIKCGVPSSNILYRQYSTGVGFLIYDVPTKNYYGDGNRMNVRYEINMRTAPVDLPRLTRASKYSAVIRVLQNV